jgi:hypothetical protein
VKDAHPSQRRRREQTNRGVRVVQARVLFELLPRANGAGAWTRTRNHWLMKTNALPMYASTVGARHDLVEPAAGSAPTPLRYERSVPLVTLCMRW